MPKVMIYPTNYDNCREAVNKAFELFPREVKGKKVLVKPNALRASNAEEAVVTHPAVVRAIVEKLEALGASEIIVGDNPGMVSYGDNEKTFQQSGLMEASKGYYQNIGADSFKVNFPDILDTVNVSRAVMEADVMISVPKFKTHGLTIITGAIKNSYGILPGALKANLHYRSGDSLKFNQVIVDVFSLRIPDLFIMDAVIGMEGNGPASPDLRDIGQILASDNAVALDAVMARMMGLDPQILPFLKIAKERGLGDYEISAIELIGELKVIPDFKYPPALERTEAVIPGFEEFFLSRINLRPKADPDLCTGCGTCVEQCPASALSIEDREDSIPEVNKEICVACFCCQEICPEMAITLQ
jgi:uncharacterized protein (DUF362 family)/NAD-dependent dihydropyrimidine dehydrogenase PreA subunit